MRWWIEGDWYQGERHMAELICRRGWSYRLYIAEVKDGKYVVKEDVTGGSSWTSKEVLEVYDLCDVVDGWLVEFPSEGLGHAQTIKNRVSSIIDL